MFMRKKNNVPAVIVVVILFVGFLGNTSGSPTELPPSSPDDSFDLDKTTLDGVLNITTSVNLLIALNGSQCNWNPPNNCENSTMYPPMDSYFCSMNADEPGTLPVTFNDPLPVGNTIQALGFTVFGRFKCDLTQPKATFMALLNDELILWNRLPDNLQGCNCTNCGQEASFTADSASGADFSTYKYGGQNIFSISLVTNDICVGFINMTFFYVPFDIDVSAINPSTGPTTGNTFVNISGSGFNNLTSYSCVFDTNPVPATFFDQFTVGCSTPAVSTSGNVTVRVRNEIQTSLSSVQFSYYATPSGSLWNSLITNYWWILLIGSLIILLGLSFFILTFRSGGKKRKGVAPDEHSKLLSNNSSHSLIKFKEDIDFKELKLAERIGRGNFGEVYMGYWRNTAVAVKKMKLNVDMDELEFLEDFQREAQIMRSLRHPNVLQFLGICDSGNNEVCIITEYMPRGSLYKILHDKAMVFDWDLRLRITVDIARGMNYLHRCDPIIIHRDLKSHNLLVDENYKVKVCDFGLAKLVDTSSVSQMTSCGTPAWTAPEVLRNEKYDEMCDVYSFGIVLWELVTREDPHHGMPPFQVVFAVGTQGIRPTIPSSCPPEFAHLIDDCWAENPRERPSFEEVIKKVEEFQRNKTFA